MKIKAERPESAVTDELNSQISKNHPELPRIFNNEAKLSSAANRNPFETNCTAQVIQSSCNRINIHRFHSIEMQFFFSLSLFLEWLNGIKKFATNKPNKCWLDRPVNADVKPSRAQGNRIELVANERTEENVLSPIQ